MSICTNSVVKEFLDESSGQATLNHFDKGRPLFHRRPEMWYCFNFNILFIHQFFGSSFLISDQMTDHQNPESAYLKSIWLFLVHLLSAFIRLFHLLMTFWNRQKSYLFCAVLCISAICSTDSGKDYKNQTSMPRSQKKKSSEWVGAPRRINTLWEKDGDTKETFTPTAHHIRHMHLTECREKQVTVVKSTTAKAIGPEPPSMMRETHIRQISKTLVILMHLSLKTVSCLQILSRIYTTVLVLIFKINNHLPLKMV